MPENEKKNAVLSLLKGVFKGKKEEYSDIITQAEKVVSDYINKRKNEIVSKYCRRRSPVYAFAVTLVCTAALYLVYVYLR